MDETNTDVMIEEINPVKKKLSFEVPWEDIKKEMNTVYNSIGKKAKIKGFRQGKVPRNILEIQYKKEAETEVITNIVSRYYADAISSRNIPVVDHPIIDHKDLEKEKKFNFTATVEISPEIEPKDYIGIEVEKEEMGVSDGTVDARLEHLRRMYATLEDVEEDRGVEEGDFTVIDFEGKLDGDAVKELANTDYILEVGSKTFVPGFEEQVIGMKKNETKKILVSFPENYNLKKVAGKKVDFSVAVKNIKIKKLPELDENFLKNFDKFESLDDLKDNIRKSVILEDEERIKSNLKGRIIDVLLEKNDFEVPSVFVERQTALMVMNMQRSMAADGIDPAKAAEFNERFRDRFREQASRIVKASLLVGKIAEKESITVDDVDIEEKLKEYAEKYGQGYETVKKIYDENVHQKEQLKDQILEEKVLEFIEEKAKITVVKKEEKEPKKEISE